MAKYRKKALVIEAWRFADNKTCFDVLQEMGVPVKYDYQHSPDRVFIETLEGNMYISDGDFVIKGIKGEFYPCKPDIFEQTYELVE
jgi:hypothetical protein